MLKLCMLNLFPEAMLNLFPEALRWRVYSRLVGNPCSPGPDVITERRVNGSRMLLNRSDWMENFAAISGSFYDATTIAVLQQVLGKGWAVLDVGANVGFTTLAATQLVGRSGRVTAFEPNPEAASRLAANVKLNQLDNVTLHRCGLGAADGSAKLDDNAHHGAKSMRSGAGVSVPIRRGDDFAPPEGVPLFVKIDVEGYEVEVLKGMVRLLERPNTAFFVEVTDSFLREAGSSSDELFALMEGYDAKVPTLSALGRLTMGAIDRTRSQYDVLFTRKRFREASGDGLSAA